MSCLGQYSSNTKARNPGSGVGGLLEFLPASDTMTLSKLHTFSVSVSIPVDWGQ